MTQKCIVTKWRIVMSTTIEPIPHPTDSNMDIESTPHPTDSNMDIESIPYSTNSNMDIESIPYPTNSNMDIECVNSNMFTVAFTMDAIALIKTFGEYLEIHHPFRDFVEMLEPVVVPELERFFEQKLAMYISLNLKNRIPRLREILGTSCEDRVYTVTDDDVTREVSCLIRTVLNVCYETIPPEGTISHMLDGYPLLILSKACNTNMMNAHIMGESMRRFVQIRKTYKRWLPVDLQISTISNCDIVGAPGSPLDQGELRALYRYLGEENRMYVIMLLNCLFELGDDEKVLAGRYMDPGSIIKICKSGWLCLFLSTINTRL